MAAKSKHGLALRDFRDAGTEESFAKDAVSEFDAGTFANYEAAGLIEAAPAPKAPTKP